MRAMMLSMLEKTSTNTAMPKIVRLNDVRLYIAAMDWILFLANASAIKGMEVAVNERQGKKITVATWRAMLYSCILSSEVVERAAIMVISICATSTDEILSARQ